MCYEIWSMQVTLEAFIIVMSATEVVYMMVIHVGFFAGNYFFCAEKEKDVSTTTSEPVKKSTLPMFFSLQCDWNITIDIIHVIILYLHWVTIRFLWNMQIITSWTKASTNDNFQVRVCYSILFIFVYFGCWGAFKRIHVSSVFLYNFLIKSFFEMK